MERINQLVGNVRSIAIDLKCAIISDVSCGSQDLDFCFGLRWIGFDTRCTIENDPIVIGKTYLFDKFEEILPSFVCTIYIREKDSSEEHPLVGSIK